MKRLVILPLYIGYCLIVNGQEAPVRWDVEIPQPVSDGVVENPKPQLEPVESDVLSSRIMSVEITNAPEMPELPPIQSAINVTVQMVEAPNLPEPPPPLPALPPDDPAVIARLNELRENYRGSELRFLSATVYDNRRTFLRIYPDGQLDKMVTAWSNIDFNHFSGLSVYRVKGSDGSFLNVGLLMGLGNLNTSRMVQTTDDQPPTIAELPDLSTAGPAFQVVAGDANSAAMATLEQVHDLYRKEGEKMEADFHAREHARAERKAFLLANPPKPQDVTIRFWSRGDTQQPQIEEGNR